MVRLAGVVLSDKKHISIALRGIFGIGQTRSLLICKEVGVDPSRVTAKIEQDIINKIQIAVNKYEVESDLRRRVAFNIKRLKDIKCYRGIRHRLSLPVRGQRTKTNAMTRKKGKK